MRFGKTIVVTALLGIMTQGCSNSQQQEQGLEVSADGQEVEVLETEETAETQAAQSQEEVILEEGTEGEIVDDGTDPIATTDDIGVADDSLEAIAANLGGESELAEVPAMDNSVALPVDTASIPSQSAPMPVQRAAAPYLSNAGSTDGYSVMYAHGPGSLYDSPSASANRIAGFETGDHFLVKAEGEWAKISDSAYIPANAVGNQTVPRARTHNPWK